MAARDRTLLLALVASVILAGCRAVLPLPADEAFVRPPDDAGPGILEPPEALGRYPELVQMRAGAPSPIVPRHSTIRAEVWADTAAVRIEQTFVNDSDYAFPVRYALSLPASALVDRVDIWIDGVHFQTRVEEPPPETEPEVPPAPDLLPRPPTNSEPLPELGPVPFRQVVRMLPAGAELGIELRYTQHLPERAGEREFAFPLPERGELPELSVHVHAKAARPSSAGALDHVTFEPAEEGLRARLRSDQGPRGQPFIVRWSTRAKHARATWLVAPTGPEEGYLLLHVEPPVAQPRPPRELWILLDDDGASSVAERALARRLIDHLLASLEPGDTFNFPYLFPRPRPVNTANLEAGQDRLPGSSMLLSADLDRARERVIVLISGGEPDDRGDLIRAVVQLQQRSAPRPAWVFPVKLGVGSATDTLEAVAARANTRLLSIVDPASVDLGAERLIQAMAPPIFDRLELRGGGVELEVVDRLPTALRETSWSLRAGHDELAVFRYRGDPSQLPELIGHTEVDETVLPVVRLAMDPRVAEVAGLRQQAASLLAARWRAGRLDAGLDRRLLRLGLDHQYISYATRFVNHTLDDAGMHGEQDRVETVYELPTPRFVSPRLPPPSPSSPRFVIQSSPSNYTHWCRVGGSHSSWLVDEDRVERVAVGEDGRMLPLGHASWESRSKVRVQAPRGSEGTDPKALRELLRAIEGPLEACHEHYYSKAKRRTLRLRSTLDGQRSAVRHEWLEGSLGPRGDDCIEQALEQLDWRAVARERAVVEFELEFRI